MNKVKSYVNVGGIVVDTDITAAPTDRTFREAWKTDAGKVTIDMTIAREIHRDNIRRVRQPLLDALDVEYMRTLERAGDVSVVVAKKQALRDATKDARIDAAIDADELKAVWPECLNG